MRVIDDMNKDNSQQVDFRTRRNLLPDDAFAIVEGKYLPGVDPIPLKEWNGLMNLPDDVVLRTADQQGRQLAQLYNLWGLWVESLPLEVSPEVAYIFSPAWDAADDFQAATFAASHGYYRQGMASLRSALELMVTLAGFAVRDDRKGLRKWLDGEYETKFGNMKQFLVESKLLSLELTDALDTLWRNLCKYNHSYVEASNGEIWGSNGPIWVKDAFIKFYMTYRDVMALSYILVAVGWKEFRIPKKSPTAI